MLQSNFEDFDEQGAQEIAKKLNEVHGLPIDMLDPFFEHIQIDNKLGHQKLLQNNLTLVEEINSLNLHNIVNKIHDIKHAFDLQRLEINDYYNKIGNYFPRQFVDFFAI